MILTLIQQKLNIDSFEISDTVIECRYRIGINTLPSTFTGDKKKAVDFLKKTEEPFWKYLIRKRGGHVS